VRKLLSGKNAARLLIVCAEVSDHIDPSALQHPKHVVHRDHCVRLLFVSPCSPPCTAPAHVHLPSVSVVERSKVWWNAAVLEQPHVIQFLTAATAAAAAAAAISCKKRHKVQSSTSLFISTSRVMPSVVTRWFRRVCLGSLSSSLRALRTFAGSRSGDDDRLRMLSP